MRAIALTILLILSGCARELPAEDEQAVLQRLWGQLDPHREILPPMARLSFAYLRSVQSPEGDVWSFGKTNPLPAAWPPDGSGRIVSYVSGQKASGRGFRNLDVTPYWARIDEDGRSRTIRIIEPNPRRIAEWSLSSTGPLPYRRESLYGGQGLKAAILRLASLSTVPLVADALTQFERDDLCASYDQRLLNTFLANRHKPFFDWLGCRY